MRITPLDVRKQEFRRSVRGFDCDEVRAFMATLADEYETVLVDNKQIRERIMEQDDKIAEYKTMERTLRDTLMTAEKLMQETKETANKEGDVIIQGAHQKAKSILEECRLRTEELRREIVGLRKEKETYLARFKGLAEAQIAFIETHKNDFADLDKRLVDMMDSVVDGTINSETSSRLHTSVAPEIPAAPQAINAIEEPMAQPAAAMTPNPAPANSEVDMWRDYNPGTDAAQTVNQITSEITSEIPADAASDIAEAKEEQAIPEAQETPAIENVDNTHAQVEMASRGIPVPAVEPEKAENETDAITAAISATLTESDAPQPKEEPVGH